MSNYFKKCDLWVGWLAFAISAVVYIITTEPTASLWDCAEFIATSYKLEIGHPPGAPLFMMLGRIFSLFAPSTEYVAQAINIMSALASAFTILFLFWTITHFGRRVFNKKPDELTRYQSLIVIGAGFIGAMSYTFTDTFWFSAIEGEVYALSSLFTAVVVWAMLRWEDSADEPQSNRWLVLIAYMMGLSIGVHILNLLAIPALVFIYYFKKSKNVTYWGIIKTTIIAFLILGFVNGIIISYTVVVGAWFDKLFVNTLSMPVNMGITFFVVVLFAALGYGVYKTHKAGKVVANTIILCSSVIVLGYLTYAPELIRAAANPPMNSNNPSNPYALLSLLNRDQYGSKPLIYGPTYSSPQIAVEEKTTFILDDGKYKPQTQITGYKYPSEFMFFFPRLHSSSEESVRNYKSWVDIKGRKVRYNGENIIVPTFVDNLKFFFTYQLNFMYWRYFLWNFVGRQSDVQSAGEITDGNWLSGIDFIDEIFLGPQKNLPSEMQNNKGRNLYYFLPFILGIIGLIYQLNRDKNNFSVVMWLFVMMGIALVLYFNAVPTEPRERDYIYAGSFYAFCIWVGLGVMWIGEKLSLLFKGEKSYIPYAATAIAAVVPIILAAQNWDDHDRSHRYVARDIGYNYLSSTLPNSIIINYGDNDTFPLWYNQEVEGVRTDVRIMNMSYLAADWYIDEMKVMANDSKPVPFSIPRHKYLSGTNDYVYIEDAFGKPLPIKTAIEFVISDDLRTKASMGERQVDYLPAKTLLLAVNKQNAIKSGIVKEEDAHLMVDTIVLDIKGRAIDKSELMLLDLLANFNFERPISFTQIYALDKLGMKDYLQYDGYSYRFVPIKTPANSVMSLGRVDVDYLYENFMNRFRYGNVSDPRVYACHFVQINFNATQSRNGFARLAKALIEKGDTATAVKVLDRCIEEIPFSQIRHTYMLTIPVIEAYYMAKEYDKGNAILKDYANILKEYILYYDQFKGRHMELVAPTLDEKLSLLGALFNIAMDNNQLELASDIKSFFNKMGIE